LNLTERFGSFAGYALAQPIFKLAAWARDNSGKALCYLVGWAIVNGIFTFAAMPQVFESIFASANRQIPSNMAQLPIVSLILALSRSTFNRGISRFLRTDDYYTRSLIQICTRS